MNLLPATTLTGANRVHHADALSLLNALASTSVDMILADLPYGTTACAWDTVIPFAPMWTAFRRVIKPRGAIVLTASQPFTSALVMSNPRMFRYEWIWCKSTPTGFLNANVRPMPNHESILVFSELAPVYYPQGKKRDVHTRNNIGIEIGVYNGVRRDRGVDANDENGYPVTVLDFNTPFHDREAGLHPTQKPVALFEYLIRTYTNEGELVLDPTCGSGTTAVAARNAKRRFICGDSNLDYVLTARDRLRLPFERRQTPANNDLSGLPLFAQEQPA